LTFKSDVVYLYNMKLKTKQFIARTLIGILLVCLSGQHVDKWTTIILCLSLLNSEITHWHIQQTKSLVDMLNDFMSKLSPKDK